MRKPLVILNFLIFEENLIFFFISVQYIYLTLFVLCCPLRSYSFSRLSFFLFPQLPFLHLFLSFYLFLLKHYFVLFHIFFSSPVSSEMDCRLKVVSFDRSLNGEARSTIYKFAEHVSRLLQVKNDR
jgi:hypothetical protein